jgi:chromosome segregation ATPase
MSDDLTQKLPSSQDGMLAQILTAVQNLSTRMESLEQRFTGLEQKVESLERKVGGLEQRLGSLEQRMGSLEQKVEERLYDTRPIWEKVQADIAGLQEGQRSLQEGQDALRKDVREANTHWRDMNRRLSLFNDTLAEMQTDYRDIYDRVRGLEKQSS